MNAFEMNKIIGAVLGTLLLVMGVGFLAEALYAPIEGRATGYSLPDASDEEGHGEEVVEVAVVPLAVLLASASAEDGARVSRKCQSCHNFGEGESNKVGPVLFGIVGSTIGANAEFAYSDVMGAKNAAGDTWTYEALNDFLVAPKEFAPGTKMSFAGLRKDQDRVDLMAYLQSLAASPVPFPTAEAMEVEQEAVVVEETAVVEMEAVQEEAAPVVEEEAAPMVEETAPAVEEAAAIVEETAPVVEETAPVVEEAAPVAEAAPVVEEAAPAAEEAAAAEPEEPSFASLLAGGDVDKGARVARKCTACHGFKVDDGNKVGPPLYNIINRAMGAAEGFKYSDGMIAKGAEGGVWTYENLNTFLIKPRDFVSRTKMSFSGLRKDEDRANLFAYLQTLSDSPVAFPE